MLFESVTLLAQTASPVAAKAAVHSETALHVTQLVLGAILGVQALALFIIGWLLKNTNERAKSAESRVTEIEQARLQCADNVRKYADDHMDARWKMALEQAGKLQEHMIELSGCLREHEGSRREDQKHMAERLRAHNNRAERLEDRVRDLEKRGK